MTRATVAVFVVVASFAAGCASAVRPVELARAEQTYARALEGVATRYASLDLEAARSALHRARMAWDNGKDGEAARDFAYVAARRVELAEARAEETRDLLGETLLPVCGAPDPTAPEGDPSAAPTSSDQKLPPSPTRPGVVVPSDVGLGAGPSGPSTKSGTSPSTTPATPAP